MAKELTLQDVMNEMIRRFDILDQRFVGLTASMMKPGGIVKVDRDR